jgi:hypothetical protein
MRVTSSQINWTTEHRACRSRSQRLEVEAWVDRPGQAGVSPRPAPDPQARQVASGQAAPAGTVTPPKKPTGCCLDTLKADLLRQMLEKLTGRELSRPEQPGDLAEPDVTCEAPHAADASAGQDQARQGWGIRAEVTQEIYEAETTCIRGRAQVRTADGKCIDVDLSLVMAREFRQSLRAQFQAGDAKLTDPLVVNFDAPAAALTERTFTFDLDADGTAEQLANLRSGSGFLALDANDNGRIDDGRELFGPATGQGFAELSAHDEDGNGWIDEADSVFDRLRVWTPEADGGGRLRSLEQLGIGAVALSAAEASFDLTGSTNELLGRLRATSLFLREDGQAGTVQQIDLAT